MRTTTILNGSVYDIPADLLTAHVRHARKGHRLVICDPYDDLVKALFEKGDAHIDLWLGNYDLLADHRLEHDCEIAAREVIGFAPQGVRDPAIKMLTRILYDQARSYGSIEEVADNIRACGHEQVRRVMGNIPANDAKAATLTWTIMSTLREYADDFIAQAPHTRRMSVTEWETCEPSSILFVSHCSYSSPIAKVLRKKLATGLGLFARIAELTFSGDDNDVYDDGAIQLELGLPGTARHELVIDLWDGFDVVAQVPAAAVIAPPPPVVVPISPLPKAPETAEADASAVALLQQSETIDADALAVTLLQPGVSTTEIDDPAQPPPPDLIEERNPTAVRRQQRRLLTAMATATGLLGAWVFLGDDHSRDQHRSAVTVQDLVRRDRLDVEWVAKHEAAFEKTEATRDAR